MSSFVMQFGHNRPLISKLLEMGVEVTEESEGIRIPFSTGKSQGCSCQNLYRIQGFPTDMQAQFTALMTVAKGIHHDGKRCLRIPSNTWRKCAVWACIQRLSVTQLVLLGDRLYRGRSSINDLRASAALILTGLVAQGETVVGKLVHLDRGGYTVSMRNWLSLGAEDSRNRGK